MTLQTITPDERGTSWDWTEGKRFDVSDYYALCRCGQSAHKPFCDGAHARAGFDGTETAAYAQYEERAHTFEGPTMVLKDNRPLCAFARFCDNDESVWKQINRPGNLQLEQLMEHEVTHCPSGRLVLLKKQDSKQIEPDFHQSLGVVEDPQEACSGPLWVRGGIQIISASGEQYEKRNRATLCRCGASSNKPFCDGSHAGIHFRDGLTEAAG